MGNTIELVKAYFDASGLHYSEDNERKLLSLLFSELREIDRVIVHLFFDETSVQIGIYNLCKVTKENIDIAYEVCSDMNRKYHFVKYYLSPKTQNIAASIDMICQPDSCGEQVYSLMMTLIRHADEVYRSIVERLNGDGSYLTGELFETDSGTSETAAPVP